jgi:hypothetical protein
MKHQGSRFTLNNILIEVLSEEPNQLTLIESKPDRTVVYHQPTDFKELWLLMRDSTKHITEVHTGAVHLNKVLDLIINNSDLIFTVTHVPSVKQSIT